MGVIVERLQRIADVEAEFFRGCGHVEAVHAAAADSSTSVLGICGFHPELGLMCAECGGCHAAEVHVVLRCDYCRGSMRGEEVYPRVWAGVLPAAAVKVAAVEELLALIGVRFMTWGVPMCCGREVCRAAADAEIDAVTGSHGV